MSYTRLRVVDDGIILFEGHLRRMAAAGEAAASAFLGFAETALPGCYALTAEGAELRTQAVGGSRLRDGMPVRLAPSPLIGRTGPIPKPASPCVYDPVRVPEIATLLVSRDGMEVYEGCAAAVIGWEGGRFVLAPSDRPRVASVSEEAVRAGLCPLEKPLLVESRMPIALINAVKGVCRVSLLGREPFPETALAELAELFRQSTRRTPFRR